MREKKERIVVFCAHSDDQILGPGGTLARYAKEGKEVYTYIFSFGENSHPWLKEKVTAEMRVREAEAADKIIGGRGVVFFGLKEGRFRESVGEKKLKSMLRDTVQKLRPSKVFTHSADDPHPDHRAVQQIVMEAIRKEKYAGDVYAFNVWGPFRLHQRSAPRLYVDITETFQTKMKALGCFRSQWSTMLLLTWSVYVRAWWAGTHNDCNFAESFVKVN